MHISAMRDRVGKGLTNTQDKMLQTTGVKDELEEKGRFILHRIVAYLIGLLRKEEAWRG